MWPDGAQSAVALTFDFDAESVWIAEEPRNADRPGVLSQGTYGAKVGVPLILELLARHDVRATFFVPGVVAERYPERVEQIVAGGHELGLHGYTHTSPSALDPSAEEQELTRAMVVLGRFAQRVTGYRSPSWDFSGATLGLLEKHGVLYSSNLMDDYRPYVHPGGVVELPVQWLLDDAAHFWFSASEWLRGISPNSVVEEIWRAELAGIHALGGCCVLTMHPQIIGRPGRLILLDSMISHVQSIPGAWIAPCEEIAQCLRQQS